MKRMKLLFTLALPVLLLQNAQAQLSRLTAQANWINDGVIFLQKDTTAYMFGNPNYGGDLTHTMKYTNAYTWVATDSTLAPNTLMTQEFYSNDNIKSTATQTWNVFSGWWDNTAKVLYGYDATTNNMTSAIHQVWPGGAWSNVSRNVYEYTGTNQLESNTYQHWFGADFFTDSAKYYTYFGSGNIKQELDYDSVASLGALIPVRKYVYSYDTANRLSSVTKYNIAGGTTSTAFSRYDYQYDGMGNRIETLYSLWNTTSSAWDAKNKHSYSSFTSAHLPQVDEYTKYDTAGGGVYLPVMHYSYTYNSNNQMTSMTGESYNALGFPEYAYGDPRSMYYYGTYTVGVKEVASANVAVNIFPNPAQNTVNIDLKWNEAQAFTVSIFDMNGSVVRQWAVPATASYNTSVPVENLPTGNYIVKVSGAKEQIARQIVVAH